MQKTDKKQANKGNNRRPISNSQKIRLSIDGISISFFNRIELEVCLQVKTLEYL